MKPMFFLLLCFVFMDPAIDAQQLKPLTIQYFQDNKSNSQQNIFIESMSKEKIIITQNTFYLQIYSPTLNLKCTLPKGAIFCRMEDAIYNRLNFWIKFRMGTDDRYSN